tara:strand:- start:503 stop:772 length:270 start_codon:yes stop_codon:yes gene_type:complete
LRVRNPFFPYCRGQLLTKRRHSGTEIVKLVIGKKRKEFSIHKNFVCQASEVMKAAFCGHFEEGKTGVMTLDEESPMVCTVSMIRLVVTP